jgi:DNA-binding response OmpR family regulator
MSTHNGDRNHAELAGVGLLSREQTRELARALAFELVRLRLIESVQPQTENRIVSGPLSVNIKAFEVVVADSIIKLKPREFALLKALAQNLGHVLSRDQIIDLAWPDPMCVNSNRTVDVHIRRLRLQLGEAGPLIRTVCGIGYKLVRLTQQADVDRTCLI